MAVSVRIQRYRVICTADMGAMLMLNENATFTLVVVQGIFFLQYQTATCTQIVRTVISSRDSLGLGEDKRL